LGIIIVINFLATRHFTRIDLTQNKEFTISESTKKVLKELDDVININAYFSKNLPPYLSNLERQVKDILDEYKAFAQGNLMTEFIDPASNPTLEQKVRFMGIPQAQLNIFEKDKAEVVNVYFGIAVIFEDRKEVIPIIQNVMALEYDLTSAIIKVRKSEPKTVGFLTGHREFDLQRELEVVRNSLEKQYSITTVDISGGKRVPENINTLIIGGPKDKFSDRDKYEVDQFLMRGGKIMFLIDPIDIGEQGLMATEIDTNLGDMLEHYGVKIGKSMVLDRESNANATFSSGYIQYSIPYPFWVRVTRQQMSRENPMVNQLENLVFPWTAPLELISSKVGTSGASGGDKLKDIELCRSSQYSWTISGPYGFQSLSPQQNFIPTQDMKNFPLAIAVTGKFKSFYADKPVPEITQPIEDTSETNTITNIQTVKESPETQIIVVGNAKFMTSGFLSQFRANRLFIENAVDWMTLGDELINIRSRNVPDRPLKQISEEAKFAIRVINIVGIPILVIVYGLARFILKRRARKLFETYSSLGGAK